MKRLFTAGISLLTISLICLAQSPSRLDLQREIETKLTELKALEKQFLSPAPEDKETYAAYLGRKDMGLIRLLPRSYGRKNNLKVPEALMRGGGAYYSFSRLTHEYGYGSDISLDQDKLLVGFAGADYGLIADLGDVPLETISVEDARAGFMAAYEVPSELTQARAEGLRFTSGVTEDGVTYKNRVPVAVRSTYLLRSVNYNRADLLVAFKVVRKDSDGSLIIVWKLLKNYPKPQLASNQE